MKIVAIIFSLILIVAGALLPMWLLAFAGLLLFSGLLPFFGIPAGFLLDIIFGVPPIIPEVVGYPFMFVALVMGIISIVLRRFLR